MFASVAHDQGDSLGNKGVNMDSYAHYRFAGNSWFHTSTNSHEFHSDISFRPDTHIRTKYIGRSTIMQLSFCISNNF